MPQQTDNDPRFLLVDESVLPEVFAKVVEAKDLLRSGRASTAAQAARLAGISRTAFYKYRDAVFSYDAGKSGGIVTVHLILQDNPGVLSALLAAFADAGANILTVNQNIPAGNVASVSVSARTDRLQMPVDAFIGVLRQLNGVQRIARIAGEDQREAVTQETSPE